MQTIGQKIGWCFCCVGFRITVEKGNLNWVVKLNTASKTLTPVFLGLIILLSDTELVFYSDGTK